MKQDIKNLCLNSTMVRLKRSAIWFQNTPRFSGLNSTMVRLKPTKRWSRRVLLQAVSIKRWKQVSIPLWFD